MRSIIFYLKDKPYDCMIDDEDFEFVMSGSSYFVQQGANTQYIRGKIDGRRQSLHRVIYARHNTLKSDQDIDHIDGNGLNNQKNNLRIATPAQNGHNRGKQNTQTSSRYKGVGIGYKGQWRVRIKLPNGRFCVKSNFDNERDAAIAYDLLAVQHYGEFARLNVPNATATERSRVADILPAWKFRGKTSRFKGVCFSKTSGKWQVSFWANGSSNYFGQYTTEEEAARVYNEKAKSILGESADLNQL